MADLDAFNVDDVKDSDDPKLEALEKSIQDTIGRIFEPDTIEFNRYIGAANLDYRRVFLIGGAPPTPISEIRQEIKINIVRAREILGGIIRTFAEEIEHAPGAEPEPKLLPMGVPVVLSNRVFVVHGHDDAAREAVARFVEKLGYHAVILHEQPNEGRTIIEKFEKHGESAAFAVVLLTPDDIGGPKGTPPDQLRKRARQNVVAELFYFIGRLGRANVCALKKGDVEVPSDFRGVVYTLMDDGDGWQLKLAQEMQAAGLSIDFNKVFRR